MQIASMPPRLNSPADNASVLFTGSATANSSASVLAAAATRPASADSTFTQRVQTAFKAATEGLSQAYGPLASLRLRDVKVKIIDADESARLEGDSSGKNFTAFVREEEPKTLYIVSDSPDLANGDPQFLRHVVTHELTHTLSTGFGSWVQNSEQGFALRGNYIGGAKGVPAARALVEGMTEYFAGKVSHGHAPFYDRDTAIAAKIVSRLGEAVVKKAYFGNDPAALRQVVDQLKRMVDYPKKLFIPKT